MKLSPLLPVLLSLLSPASTHEITLAAMLPRQASTSVTSSSLAPSTTVTPDSWRCATANISQFFDPPKPTGTLLSALISYGDSLIAPCTRTATGTQLLACTVSDPAAWCPYSTKAPASVSAAYATYAKGVGSWWAAKSAAAVRAQVDCPVTWGNFRSSDVYWLNMTVAHASCYLKVNPIVSSSSSAATGATTSSGTSKATSSTTTTTTAATGTSSRPTNTTSRTTTTTAATTAK